MATKDIKGEIFNAKSSTSTNGYLICQNCQGFYQLKNNESPEDFDSCECGSPLEFHENFQNIPNDEYDNSQSLDNIYDDYTEIEQLLTILKSKAEKRKSTIKTLSNRIQIQEGLLNEIKEERWTLWDVLNERNLQSDIRNQKRLLDDITAHEDRLMMIIKEQRQRAHNPDGVTYYIHKIGAVGFLVIEFLIIVILVVLLLI